MTRKDMQKEVLESMVKARDTRVEALEKALLAANRLNLQQGDKVLELLVDLEACSLMLWRTHKCQ